MKIRCENLSLSITESYILKKLRFLYPQKSRQNGIPLEDETRSTRTYERSFMLDYRTKTIRLDCFAPIGSPIATVELFVK